MAHAMYRKAMGFRVARFEFPYMARRRTEDKKRQRETEPHTDSVGDGEEDGMFGGKCLGPSK